MGRYLIRRFLFAVVTLLASTVIVFGLSRLAGDPLMLYAKPGGYGMTEQRRADLIKKLGLDRPLAVQYGVWLGRVLKGDLGQTIVSESKVSVLISQRISPTLQLGSAAFIFAIFLGVPLGILSAVRRGSIWDYAGRTIALVGQAAPIFWLALMAILLFAVQLRWLPVGTAGPDDIPYWSWGKLKYLVMPAVALGWGPAAAILRLTRSSMLDVLDAEYITLARAKGVSSRKVIWKHAFRNAILQPLTVAALTLAGFITGAVVIERIFAWPGIGQLTMEAVWNNEFPTLTATVLFLTAIYVVMNLIADIAYVYLNPIIRYD
jgi:peptide/nickel transport system permease protein|tara:strand:- start:156 stop:1112 length:957 start_codon:yes stop_codon:yes gene_type:complete